MSESWVYQILEKGTYLMQQTRAKALAEIAEGVPPRQAIANAMKSSAASPTLPYSYLERPRFLEEALNYMCPGFPPEMVFLISIVYMMKKEPKMLERLALKWMDTQQQIIHGLAQAGAGNIVAAYGSNFLIALMLEQNYLIRQRGADDLIASLNWLTGAQVAASLFKDFAVPATLIYSAAGGEFPSDTAAVLRALRGKEEPKKPKAKTDYSREKTP